MDTKVNTSEESRLSCERPAHAKSNARLTMLFTGLTLLVGIFVVGAVAYDDIYIHPADPPPAGTATTKIWGEGETHIRFTATVGTLADEHNIEGETPITFEAPYRRADYVVWRPSRRTRMSPNPAALKAKVQVEGETMDKGQTEAAGGNFVPMWEAPRAPKA